VAAALLDLNPRDWPGYFQSLAPKVEVPKRTDDAADPDGSLYAGLYSHQGEGPLRFERTADGLRGTQVNSANIDFGLDPQGRQCLLSKWVHQALKHEPSGGQLVLSFAVEQGRAVRCDMRTMSVTLPFVRQDEPC
jgi:hypothetical protein